MKIRYLHRLLQARFKAQLVLPSFTPNNWMEIDSCLVLSDGRVIECEIKTSRADFRADAKKTAIPWSLKRELPLFGPQVAEGMTKWDVMRECPTVGPSQFYFVVPAGLIKEDEVPEWAGLVEISCYADGTPEYIYVRRKAPKRNTNKLSEAEKGRALRNISLRYATGTHGVLPEFGHRSLTSEPPLTEEDRTDLNRILWMEDTDAQDVQTLRRAVRLMLPHFVQKEQDADLH